MEGVKPGVGVVLDEERTVGWTTSPVRTRGSAFATAVPLGPAQQRVPWGMSEGLNDWAVRLMGR